jgi:hypothetical protein
MTLIISVVIGYGSQKAGRYIHVHIMGPVMKKIVTGTIFYRRF